MKNSEKIIEILSPKNQLHLYGYNNEFNNFANLYAKNRLPNAILLSGPKGIGKSTFLYHFINFLLSSKEDNKYSLDNNKINESNISYNLVCNNMHPNVFLLENESLDETIKVDNVRSLLKFLSKTTYNSNIKIVLIDNSEFLNINASNALLKSLEEHNLNTFFFLIHNSSSKILDTIKSRCVQFKYFLNIEEKKKIIGKLINQYSVNISIANVDELLFFESPGNILKYFSFFNESNENFLDDKLFAISFLIDKYKKSKDPQVLSFITSMVELFYNRLSIKNNKRLNIYFYNKSKILNSINKVKKFNLDKNNLFITLLGMIKNER